MQEAKTIEHREGILLGVSYRQDDDLLQANVLEEGPLRAVARYHRRGAWRLVDVVLEFRHIYKNEYQWVRQGGRFTAELTMALAPHDKWLYLVLMNRADAFLQAYRKLQ